MSETEKAYKLKRLRYSRIALVDRGANQFADIVLAKREDKMAETKADVKVEVHIPEDVQKTIDEAKAVVAKVADLEKRAKEAEDQAKAAQAKVAAMEDAEIAKRFAEKAASFSGVPGLTAEKAPLLRKMYATLSADEAKEADTWFRAASEIASSSKLLQEIGTKGGFGGDSYAKLEKLAREVAKADKISYERAFAQVSDTDEGKVLLRQHEQEREDTARRVR